MRYTQEQISKKRLNPVTGRSKYRYALYVDQGDTHEPVLTGANWDQCHQKTAELVANGVSWTNIYGEIQSQDGPEHWGNARKHLWWTAEDDAKQQ